MRANRITGLFPWQFEELIAILEETLKWGSGQDRRKALTFRKAVDSTLMRFKNNVTQEFIADLFRMSQSTISRVIRKVEKALAKALEDFEPDPVEALGKSTALVDGTLLPCWSWRDRPELWSGKHKTTGHSCQVVSTLEGRIISISEPPTPGKNSRRQIHRPLKNLRHDPSG